MNNETTEGSRKAPRTHQSHWQDKTITARSQKRTSKDDAWANEISLGKYPTLRKLMTAIHNGQFCLVKGS